MLHILKSIQKAFNITCINMKWVEHCQNLVMKNHAYTANDTQSKNKTIAPSHNSYYYNDSFLPIDTGLFTY